MNLLGLDTYHILTVHEDEHDFSIEAELMAPPSCCMHCGSGLLYKHERISRLIMDIPIRGKRVGIVLQQRRYRCRACNRSFFEQFPDVHAHHSMTVRLVNYIQQQALRRTFTSIADDVGLDEWTIRSIFRESTAHLSEKAIDEPVTILGIDEVYLLHKPRCVLTNIEQRTILDLLHNRDKTTVKNYLQRLPVSIRTGITCVCMVI